MAGSGKSTTAHFIARQLEKNGVKVKWFHEVEKNHPLHYDGKVSEKENDESDANYSQRIMAKYPEIWSDFVNMIKDDIIVYIVESYLFQDVLLFPHFMNDIDRQIIKDFSHKILEITRCLNPLIIHLYQKDIENAIRLNWVRRGDEWKAGYIGYVENTLYCKNRNAKGETGLIQLWQDFTDFTVELFQEYDFRKFQIENSAQEWKNYRQQICDFLELNIVEEYLSNDSLDRFCGEYLGNGFLFKIHMNGSCLCLDAFWPNLKLLPISENEFEIEGFPIRLKFFENKEKGEISLKLTKALCYYTEGTIAKKYISLNLSKKELAKFCGDFYCESTKLSRKIYQKDGKLYYWREENDESLLIPITESQLMMTEGVENQLDFKLVNEKWQFTLDIKGGKPSFSLFINKNIDQETELTK